MKPLLSLVAAAALAAGCATTEAPVQVAQAECKIAPITTTSMTYAGKKKPVSDIEQRWAQAQLGATEFRYRNLASQGLVHNNVEDALRDCD